MRLPFCSHVKSIIMRLFICCLMMITGTIACQHKQFAPSVITPIDTVVTPYAKVERYGGESFLFGYSYDVAPPLIMDTFTISYFKSDSLLISGYTYTYDSVHGFTAFAYGRIVQMNSQMKYSFGHFAPFDAYESIHFSNDSFYIDVLHIVDSELDGNNCNFNGKHIN